MPRRTRRALNRIRARTWSSCNWTNSGISFKKKNKLWIWLAFDRSGQRLIDWECGNRDAATLNRLLERLKPWSVTLYCTDDYAPYDTLLPVGRHSIGKDETVAIERVNSRLRHWFARFRRRPCVVSKALEMVDATIALFAAYHVIPTALEQFRFDAEKPAISKACGDLIGSD